MNVVLILIGVIALLCLFGSFLLSVLMIVAPLALRVAWIALVLAFGVLAAAVFSLVWLGGQALRPFDRDRAARWRAEAVRQFRAPPRPQARRL